MTKRYWPCRQQPLARFSRQTGDIRVVNVVRENQRFLPGMFVDFALLTLNITFVARLHFELLHHLFELFVGHVLLPGAAAYR